MVREMSMAPALLPGDRLLVDRRAYARGAPAVGDVVLLADPERPGQRLLKRVAAPPAPIGPGRLWIRGDRDSVSRDSRQFGSVPLSAVLGRVWFRYAPPARRGPIGSERAPVPDGEGPGRELRPRTS